MRASEPSCPVNGRCSATFQGALVIFYCAPAAADMRFPDVSQAAFWETITSLSN
jgi:hypothetical protein